MAEFVEMPPFSRRVRELLPGEDFRQLQQALLLNPDLGEVMQGCGGLRKLRWNSAKRNKGKRGGCRVIYLCHPEAERIDLIAIYSKNEKDDLNDQERKVLRKLALLAKAEVRKRLNP